MKLKIGDKVKVIKKYAGCVHKGTVCTLEKIQWSYKEHVFTEDFNEDSYIGENGFHVFILESDLEEYVEPFSLINPIPDRDNLHWNGTIWEYIGPEY